MVTRELITKVLTDPRLRAQLAIDPAQALGMRMTTTQVDAVKKVLTQGASLEDMVSSIDKIITPPCGIPSPCGIP